MEYNANLSIDLPPSQAFLNIDTKSRIPGQPLNNCEVTKAGSYFQMDKAVRYSLQYVNFTWCIKNVSNRNNKIKVYNSVNTEFNVVIPTGFYNLSAFITAMQTALNSAFAGFVVTDTGAIDGHRIRIENPAGYKIGSSGQVRSPWEMCGFNFANDSGVLFTDHRGYAKIHYSRYIDVCSRSLSRYQSIQDECSNFPTSNVLVRIYGDDGTSTNAVREDMTSPLTQPHNVQFTFDYPKWVQFARSGSSQALGSNIDLTLIDEYGQVVDMDDAVNAPDYSLIFMTRALR